MPLDVPSTTGDVVSRLGFAEVQALLAALEKDARSAPHENFWNLDYEAFVAFEFPESWGTPGRRIRLLQPYDAQASNLIRALRGEGGVTIRLPDGSMRLREDLERMPKGAHAMPLTSIRAIELWIDAGCPEFAGRPSTLSRPAARRADPYQVPPLPESELPAGPGSSSSSGPAPALPPVFPPPTSGSESGTPAPVPPPPLPDEPASEAPPGHVPPPDAE